MNCVNKRSRKYLTLILVLIGAVIAYAAFFTAANNFSKVAFSLPENDYYEVDSRWFNGGKFVGDHYSSWFGLYLYKHKYDVHYLVLETQNLDGVKEVSMSMKGILEGDDPILVFSKDDISIKEGINIIEIPSIDISLLKYEIDGIDHRIIKKAYFCNAIYDYSIKKAVLFTCFSIILYTIICIGIISKYDTYSKKS